MLKWHFFNCKFHNVFHFYAAFLELNSLTAWKKGVNISFGLPQSTSIQKVSEWVNDYLGELFIYEIPRARQSKYELKAANNNAWKEKRWEIEYFCNALQHPFTSDQSRVAVDSIDYGLTHTYCTHMIYSREERRTDRQIISRTEALISRRSRLIEFSSAARWRSDVTQTQRQSRNDYANEGLSHTD